MFFLLKFLRGKSEVQSPKWGGNTKPPPLFALCLLLLENLRKSLTTESYLAPGCFQGLLQANSAMRSEVQGQKWRGNNDARALYDPSPIFLFSVPNLRKVVIMLNCPAPGCFQGLLQVNSALTIRYWL